MRCKLDISAHWLIPQPGGHAVRPPQCDDGVPEGHGEEGREEERRGSGSLAHTYKQAQWAVEGQVSTDLILLAIQAFFTYKVVV